MIGRGPQMPAVLMEPPAHAITFEVGGRSATKGSTVSFLSGDGRVITKADNARLKAWSEDVAWAARAARVKRVPLPGAVGMRVLVVFARPASVSVAERPFPTVTPDIDKCLRAAFDALTGIAYDDDKQVIGTDVGKIYGDQAAVLFQVWEVRP